MVCRMSFVRELAKRAELDLPRLFAGLGGGLGAEAAASRVLRNVRSPALRGALLGGSFGLGYGLSGDAADRARGRKTAPPSDIGVPVAVNAALGGLFGGYGKFQK